MNLRSVEIDARCHRCVHRDVSDAVCPITEVRKSHRAGSEPTVVALVGADPGSPPGHWTPLAAPAGERVGGPNETRRNCADSLRETGNMSPWKSTLDRLPKHVSSRWEDCEAFEEALRTMRWRFVTPNTEPR